MKHKKLKNSKKIAKSILQAVGLATTLTGVIVFPGLAHVVKWVQDTTRDDPRRVKKSFNRMRSSGTVRLILRDNRWALSLTEKGRKQMERYRFHDLRLEKPRQWDSKWRLVMFDIPESQKRLRELVRRKLLSLGFILVQKSVYIHPYPCEKVVASIRAHYRVGHGQLYLFESEVLEGERVLKKHFNL